MTCNPVIRVLVVILVAAAGIRIIYELLEPVIPWLFVGVVILAALQIVRWYRGRW